MKKPFSDSFNRACLLLATLDKQIIMFAGSPQLDRAEAAQTINEWLQKEYALGRAAERRAATRKAAK